MWTEWYPLCVAAVSPLLLCICQYIFSSDFPLSDLRSWNWKLFARDKDKVWPRWNPVGHGCIHNMCRPLCVTDWWWPCRRDQWFGIVKKMGAIWNGPGRSGSGLQRAETCHLPTHATAWSFYHLALPRSLIPGLCRCETQWIGTGARLHRQGFEAVKGFFFFSLLKPV